MGTICKVRSKPVIDNASTIVVVKFGPKNFMVDSVKGFLKIYKNHMQIRPLSMDSRIKGQGSRSWIPSISIVKTEYPKKDQKSQIYLATFDIADLL